MANNIQNNFTACYIGANNLHIHVGQKRGLAIGSMSNNVQSSSRWGYMYCQITLD